MGFPGESDAVADGGAAHGAGGVVPRPVLFERLGTPALVTVVSAPAGSGKTVLLRSWIGAAGLTGHAAWVTAGGERDPQRFWLSVADALRGTGPGAGLVRPVSVAPDLDGWAIVEGLLKDLAPLADPVWLVVDDVHELDPDQALRQLELLIMRAPPQLRFVLAARHDLPLGLHRLRLEGELAEIREDDLRFSVAEAAELFSAADVELPGPAVEVLHERTEGWAAGLRLAALATAAHPDPARFAAEFSGAERTVAEYLLAEVLDRQPEPVRRLLLRTSVLERVNGELADLLTGDSGGERVLQDLEAANAFVTSLDGARSWFRYHQMFAGLLRLELRRTTPGKVAGLHHAAAGWLAGHGYPVEAIRHAQAAGDWPLAARLLAEHWPGLHLDGRAATIHDLVAGFPAKVRAADAGLAVVAAADELAFGSLEAAERYLRLAERGVASAPENRRGQVRLFLGAVGMQRAGRRGNLPAVAEEARRLYANAMTGAADAARPEFGEDLRALALVSLGAAEFWTAAHDDAVRHLERGVALARRIGRPYLEFTGLAYQAQAVIYQSFARATELGRQAAGLGERHGWTDDPAFGIASLVLGAVLTWQARLEEAEPWVQRAERTLRAETQPADGLVIRYIRGMLELARGRDAQALAAFRAAEPLAERLAGPHSFTPRIRALLVHALVRLSQTESAEQFLAGLDERDRDHGAIRIADAELRLARGDPRAASAVLASVLDGPAPADWRHWVAQAFMLEAQARDALGDPAAAESALERALDLAEPNGVLAPFLLYAAPALLERHARHRTAHAALLGEIQSLLNGQTPAGPAAVPLPPSEPLSGSELRVLRYLPTNLTAPEIARELSVSPNTVKTHIRALYSKLGTHRRAGAVDRARALGMLAPSAAAKPKPAARATR